MSKYVAGVATQLGVGEQQQLVNGTLGAAAYTSPAVAIGRDASGFDLVTLFNNTNQTATVQVSPTDTDAGFTPLTDSESATAITVAAGVAGIFRCIAPFLRLSFVADTTGTATVTR